MKTILTLVIIMTSLSLPSFASPQAEEGKPEGQCTIAPSPDGSAADLEAFLNANGPQEGTNPWGGYWHCTAYAQGHGHSWGYDYKDKHYNHAYYGAMQRCEYMTHHHCHDVHCHYDHH